MIIHDLELIEIMITEFIANGIKNLLFFISSELQSILVTIFHYLIFIVGIFYFYFIAKPKSLSKKIFFLFALLAYISYLIFDKCLCSSVEYKLYSDRNFIQSFMNGRFGDGEEGKTVSKSNLLMISIFLGLSLLYDYRIFKNKK
jgi:hypothetical protein